MGTRLAVASVNFFAGFTASLLLQVKKQLRPGETIVQCVTDHQHDSAFATGRLLSPLESDPRPVALILISVRPAAAVVEAYRTAGIPVILIDEEAVGSSTVAVDNVACGKLAAEHLVRSGRRSIAVVSGPAKLPGGYSALQRQLGVRQALGDAGLVLADENVIEVENYSVKDGVSAMTALLERRRRVDGIFCAAGDTTATGMLEAAQARGVRVPGELSIVGCDNLPCSAISDPPLTTIEQPLEAIAREAYRLAVEDHSQLLARPRRVLLPPKVILRQSA
jgi:DNA-binding LacI/PurR family transcriptional regulator